MEKIIEYRKSYYEANKQKIKENNLAYYHKMKLTKEWQNTNIESYLLHKRARSEYNAHYYQKNRDRIIEKQSIRNNRIRNNRIRNRDVMRCGDCNTLVKVIDIDGHHRMKCNSKKPKQKTKPKPKKRFQDIQDKVDSLKIYFD